MNYTNLRTVRQLMTVAEKDSIKEFTELLEENFLTLFVNARVTLEQPDLKEISVIITGLMARNARQCMEVFLKYLNNKNIPLDDLSLDAPIKLAGILICEKKCRETVNCFIKKCVNIFGSHTVEYIACMAVYADDLSVFKILYNAWGDKKHGSGFTTFLKMKYLLHCVKWHFWEEWFLTAGIFSTISQTAADF